MKRVARKHRKWKTRALTRYAKQCELYVLERRDWEFEAIIQAWGKPGILWPVDITSFNRLIELASIDHLANEGNLDYTKLVEEEDISRVGTTINPDEFEEEASTSGNSEHEAYTSDESEQEAPADLDGNNKENFHQRPRRTVR
jgi:hypothetical protein